MRRVIPVLIATVPALCGPLAHADCLDDAAANAVNLNSNGTEDIGLMQINSSWLPKLARYGIRRQDLFNPCVNGYVGTWILASNIRQFGPTWKAVGAYNAVSTQKQLIYANAIYRRLQRLGQQQ